MKVIGIIPARYGSTRFPGKPLAMIGGKPMIQRVYEQAKQAIEEVWVATDDERIMDEVYSLGGLAVMTTHGCHNGTERCAEVVTQFNDLPLNTIVVNIQGDMPFIQPYYIEELVDLMIKEPNVKIGTIVSGALSEADKIDRNCVKAYILPSGLVQDFSRGWMIIPGLKTMKHVGVYAYRANILQEIIHLEATDGEHGADLEQLRWMRDYPIHYVHVLGNVISVDTPEDLIRAEEYAEKEKPKVMTSEKKTAEEILDKYWSKGNSVKKAALKAMKAYAAQRVEERLREELIAFLDKRDHTIILSKLGNIDAVDLYLKSREK